MWQGDDETVQGLGCPGGTCMGADGHLYEWVEGVDGLGNPVGFWKRITRGLTRLAPLARRFAPLIPGGAAAAALTAATPYLRRLARRALPVAQQFAPFVPGGAAALTAATPFLRQAGVAGYDGLGALYEAPDGSLYQVQGIDGIAADDDLNGFADDDELRGLSDEELQGLAGDEELNGVGAEDEMAGLEADDELNGLAEDDELRGLQEDDLQGEDLDGFAEDDLQGMNGYVRADGINGLEAFVPDLPPATPWFRAPSTPPPMWSPIW